MAASAFWALNDSLPLFDHAVQMADLWLDDLMERLGWDDRYEAYLSLCVTLHGLRDDLPLHEAIELGRQLPLLLRGAYYEDWSPATSLGQPEDLAAFLTPFFALDDVHSQADAKWVTRTVLTVLVEHLDADATEDISCHLSQALKILWPSNALQG